MQEEFKLKKDMQKKKQYERKYSIFSYFVAMVTKLLLNL
jgi:hypothetical protein